MAKTNFTVVIFDICVHSSVISCQSCQLQPGQAGGKFPRRGASFIEVRHDFRFPERASVSVLAASFLSLCFYYEADDNHHQVTTTKTTTIPRRVELSLSFSSKYCILWSSLIIVYPIGMVSCGKSDNLLLHISRRAKWGDQSSFLEALRARKQHVYSAEAADGFRTPFLVLHTDYVVKKMQVWLRSLSIHPSIHPSVHPSVYPSIHLGS